MMDSNGNVQINYDEDNSSNWILVNLSSGDEYILNETGSIEFILKEINGQVYTTTREIRVI